MPTFSAEQIVYHNGQTGGIYLLSAHDGSVIDSIAGPVTGFPNTLYNTATPTILAGSQAFPGTDPNGDAIALYDYSFNQIALTQWGLFTTHSFPLDVDAAGNFIQANDRSVFAGVVQVRRWNGVGVQLNAWTLPYLTIAGLSVSPDGATLYYAESSDSLLGTYPNESPIHRYDLTGSAPLTDLTAGGGPGRWGNQWFMYDVSSFFVTWAPSHFPDPTNEDWVVRRMDAVTGAVLNAYPAPNPPFDGFDVSIRPDLTDGSAFWMLTEHFGSSDVVTFTKVDIATGAILRQFDIDNSVLHGEQTWWVQSTPDSMPCVGLINAPRVDGLPYVPPVVDPCGGSGTRGTPRIGA